MALIADKESSIVFLQNVTPNTLKEKLDALVFQKEQLKHNLLALDRTFSIPNIGPGSFLISKTTNKLFSYQSHT